MILIPKARYRMLPLAIIVPSASLCYGQFCILPTLSSFSLTLSYSRSSLRSPSRCAPVKPLTFPFFANRKQGGTQTRNVMAPFKVFYGFVFQRLKVLSLIPPCLFLRISFAEQITKNVYTKLIWYLSSPSTLSLNAFCSRQIISVSRDRSDNSSISLDGIGIGVKVATDTIWHPFIEEDLLSFIKLLINLYRDI